MKTGKRLTIAALNLYIGRFPRLRDWLLDIQLIQNDLWI
jgi:hypothetical protein